MAAAKKKTPAKKKPAKYDDSSIKTLEALEHIRKRPGMYIGRAGNGNSPEDGIYILLKEVIDNSIDEHMMGYGSQIDIELDGKMMKVRDWGRGIPLGKVKECVSLMNTGGKYDSEAFQKSVGMNGVGTKAVNALSKYFKVDAFRDGQTRGHIFERGKVTTEMTRAKASKEKNGTYFEFSPDEEIFEGFKWREEFIEEMLWKYAYLNTGLTIVFNGKKFKSKNGLLDLLKAKLGEEPLYTPIHLTGTDIEIAFTHATQQYGEDYYSFVNGQHTTQGGTHQAAFREGVVKTMREFFKKSFEPADVRQSIVGAISVKIQEPVFESQTKTKLGSTNTEPKGGKPVRSWIVGFVQDQLDNYLHRNPDAAQSILAKIQETEKERKELKGIRKAASEGARRAKIHNRKLRDCRAHYNSKHKRAEETSIFITEGDSASGSITKTRDVDTQAVFSLKGKPLNCFGLTKKIVYENEEFNLLQHALNIDEGLDELRYNKVIIATDADVDGMHIRLLLITFFLQFFKELINQGHVSILETPLFRVRSKKKTIYCYSEEEKRAAQAELGAKAQVTRFKGLGEIDPSEFKEFIGKNMRLEPVLIDPENPSMADTLQFYMGKNTPERQAYIVDNLKVELDPVDTEEEVGELEEAV